MRTTIAVVMASVVTAGCSVFGDRSATAEPAYEVVETLDTTAEIRRYEPRVAAEVRLAEAPSSAARGKAFRMLFNYISGENRGAAEIAMTAPVESAETSEEIAMTAPVETTAETDADGGYRMRFFLPESYSLQNAPQPTDAAVSLMELPAQHMAVLRYTGSTSEETAEERVAELMEMLRPTTWVQTAPPVAYFYDPPWTLPFLRRNEVAVPVAPRS